ncbi:carbamoyltransferase family protein [Ruminiclostridium papyrosolvens]|uniref:Carbamoyltransferase n=1 Tax=Ruminiclostridium papyrosolvens C7 TaxID=1330534 RepID=U4QZZ3_9FIRM|nr:carbamoyltransferase C-terminal domain-containing protein [Ruminiclostridium papyrosolvens]EPR10577.1 hypothetical protein L323_13745 [Ruminiclostridium papyrosolvens C7]
MYILGMGGSDHSFAACLVSDNGVVCAVEEERITREKYSLGPNSLYANCRKYCLNELNLSIDDIDMIVGNDILHPMTYFPVRKRIELINHHLAHAYSAFYTIPHDETAILIVDGTGSKVNKESKIAETVTYAVGKSGDVEIIDKVGGLGWSKDDERETLTENSLGDFYRKFTEEIGFGYLQDGKTMGLAPYGTDKFYNEVKSFVKFLGDGQFEIKINEPFIGEFVQKILSSQANEKDLFQAKADIAWAAQTVLEDCMFYCVDYLYQKAPKDVLCIAGGVGLNSVVNGKIKEKSKFKHVYVPPYTSDSGTAVGAALYGYNLLSKNKPLKKSTTYNAFTGHAYSEPEILEVLKSFENEDIEYTYYDNVCPIVAEALKDGKIIGWFQEGSEMGPRALGHRSILADPRDPEMKDKLNYRVKKREGFRPFAPAVLQEQAANYFNIDFPSPFMLFVVDVKEDKKKVIPAVTHVDGTARVQTVDQKDNPIFYNLINEFYKITDVPVLLNTSFNILKEPIVETPKDAITSFYNSQIDLLCIGNWIVTKTKIKD